VHARTVTKRFPQTASEGLFLKVNNSNHQIIWSDINMSFRYGVIQYSFLVHGCPWEKARNRRLWWKQLYLAFVMFIVLNLLVRTRDYFCSNLRWLKSELLFWLWFFLQLKFTLSIYI
jgi:hypothetical protein